MDAEEFNAMVEDFPAEDDRQTKRSKSNKIKDVITSNWTFVKAESGELVAHANGSMVAYTVSGKGSMNSRIAALYNRIHDDIVSASMIADVLNTLAGAVSKEPVPVYFRNAAFEDKLIVDLGREDERVVEISKDGWRVIDSSPVLFRRTEGITAALPMPVLGGSFEAFEAMFQLPDEIWPLVWGWAASSLDPSTPSPVLTVVASQGAGKSSFSRMLVDLLDPSTAGLLSPSSSPEELWLQASSMRVHATDNVSGFSRTVQDARCKLVTGAASVNRTLFTNADLTVSQAKCVQLVNAIDTGSIRGDLAERMVGISLERIPADERKTESEINATFEALRPYLLGSIYTLAVKMLAGRDAVDSDSLPRMADFARNLGAMSAEALETYVQMMNEAEVEIAVNDPVAQAVGNYVLKVGGNWSGSASELLAELPVSGSPKFWPSTGQQLGARVARLEVQLGGAGIAVSRRKTNGRRVIELHATELASEYFTGADERITGTPF